MVSRGRGRSCLLKLLDMPIDEEQQAIDDFEGMGSKPIGLEELYSCASEPRKKCPKLKTVNNNNNSIEDTTSDNMVLSDIEREALAAVTSITPTEPAIISSMDVPEFPMPMPTLPSLPSLMSSPTEAPHRNRLPPRRAATLAAAAVAATAAQEQADNELELEDNTKEQDESHGRNLKLGTDVEDSDVDMPPHRLGPNRGQSPELEQEATLNAEAEKMLPLVENILNPEKPTEVNTDNDLIKLINSSTIYGGVRYLLGLPEHEPQMEFNGVSTPFVIQRPNILKRKHRNITVPEPLTWPEPLEIDVDQFTKDFPEVPAPLELHIIDEIYSKALYGASTEMIMSDDSKRWKRVKEHWRRHYRRRDGIESPVREDEEEGELPITD